MEISEVKADALVQKLRSLAKATNVAGYFQILPRRCPWLHFLYCSSRLRVEIF